MGMETDVKKNSTSGILKNKNGMIVTYWPSTEPSIKRCTCVNKRKNSGSRWTLNKNITRKLTAWVSWGQDAEVRASCRQRALGPQWPTVEQPPAKMRKKCCYGQKNLGQYVAVCPRLQLTSRTQPTSTLSRIKSESYIFIKMCVRSFIGVRYYCWLCFRIYLYMYMYTCKFVYGYTTMFSEIFLLELKEFS